jgi:hypothetical protein
MSERTGKNTIDWMDGMDHTAFIESISGAVCKHEAVAAAGDKRPTLEITACNATYNLRNLYAQAADQVMEALKAAPITRFALGPLNASTDLALVQSLCDAVGSKVQAKEASFTVYGITQEENLHPYAIQLLKQLRAMEILFGSRLLPRQ